ncbi:MAG: hypothetical protein NZ528_07325 [Caldilineales bacterium]|nr:hypothetical protein [Caldilineales bacterium]MDW8317327.1 hypothetical protein [Anaerolineae bacterium]
MPGGSPAAWPRVQHIFQSIAAKVPEGDSNGAPSCDWVGESAVQAGIPTPAMSSALAFFDGYRRAWLPANRTQAQRDYFGAHTYERVDRPRGQFFHTNRTGTGGDVTASTYQV